MKSISTSNLLTSSSFKAYLTEFFTAHDPRGLYAIDEIITKFAGNQYDVLSELALIYKLDLGVLLQAWQQSHAAYESIKDAQRLSVA